MNFDCQRDEHEKINSTKTSKPDKIITKMEYSLLAFNLLVIAIVGYFSWMIMIILLALLGGYFFITSNYFKKKLKQLKLKRKLDPYMKHSKSLNHATTLIAKYLYNADVKQDETEIDTFIDMKEHLGESWPFMKKVKNTRNERITVEGQDTKCLSSYNYLDFGRNESIQRAAIEAAEMYSSGNHGPRMLCGNLQILEDLEVKISKFFDKESALVFSSGFLACMSTIAGISKKGDLLLMDKLSHASLKYGAKCCSAKVVYFKHNDFKDAEKKIKQNKFKNLIMVIEGIYSMDGDIGDLPAARKLCDKYNGTLILDEAHSLGTIGKTGRGTEEYYNYEARADIICGSFTKAISSVGGYLTTNRKTREYYTFYAPGLVFSAPLSAYHAGAALRAFEILETEVKHTIKCQSNAKYLRDKFREKGFNIGETVSCVVPVVFNCTKQCISMHDWLLKQGFFSACVLAPACPLDAPRFRITACANQTKEDLDECVDMFVKAQSLFKPDDKIKEISEAM